MRRVVVTGIGLLTPLGWTTASTWSALRTSIPALPTTASSHPVHQLPPAPTSLPPPPPFLGRDVPLSSHYALLASSAALHDASLPTSLPPSLGARTGISIGTAFPPLPEIPSTLNRLSPFLIPRILLSTPAGLISQTHKTLGPSLSPATACSASAHALHDAFHALRRGDADIFLAGGTESPICPLSLAAFARARALSNSSSRPFDASRDGFVMAEGAAVLVLEDADHARRRGAPAYAEVTGVGAASDAFHVTSPPEDGAGAVRSMRAALACAGVAGEDVDYVNAHATSTPLGDAVERRAIAEVCTGHRAVASSTKGAMGHLLGAAGAVEAAITVLALNQGWVPGTGNLKEVDDCPVCEERGWGGVEKYLPGEGVEREVNVALSNSFGFGGTNASIVFGEAKGLQKRVVVGSEGNV